MSELAPGRRIDDFEIIEVAGEGGMGVVYRAIQVSLGREVALKLIAPAIANEDDFRTRFDHESRLAASIDHPHVVSIYAAGEHEGRPYLAMQWIPGRGLDRFLREGPLGLDRTVGVISQIGGALDVAHATGLIHRDVKPGNILLRSFGGRDHAYLVDFGIARNTAVGLAGLTRTGSMVGTLGYMAPEQLRGERGDARSDLYALGCVVYECLTGRRPFERDNEAAVLWAHGHDPRPRPSQVADLPAALDEVIGRALAIDPDERFQSGAELTLALEAASDGAPIPPPQPRPVAAATAVTAPLAGEGPAEPTAELGADRTAIRPLPPPDGPPGRARIQGAISALLGGLVVAALVFAAGIAVAAATPPEGFLDLQGAESTDSVEEGARQAWSFSQASLAAATGDATLRVGTLTFVLIPLVASLLVGFGFARLTRGAPAIERLAWAAATGFSFAVVMLVLAAVTDRIAGEPGAEFEPRPVAVALLSLLWGGLGATAGAALALRREGGAAPRAVTETARTVWPAWRSLGLALLVGAAIGTAAVVIQTLRDAGDVRTLSQRDAALAGGETAAYALDHGIRFLALGAGAEFRNPGAYGIFGLPLPVTKSDEVVEPAELGSREAPGFRLFDYERALPAWAFAGLLGLIVVPVFFALHGGAAVARSRAARSAATGAAWGAVVGPAWALLSTGLAAVSQKPLYGELELGSVAVIFLIGGATLGAAGGAVAGWRGGRRARLSEPARPRGRAGVTPPRAR